jgi:2-polyprenyl-3-methyl-5-hydroxy-6-metoxy-1,4-benzoquinol methylase
VNGRDVPKKAIVLVASKQVILRRLEQRVLVEKSDSASLKTNEYPSLHWKRLIEQEDLDTIYQAWCEELESCNIPYKIIDATDDTYPEVESKDQLPDIVNGVDSNYTRKQLEELLKKRKFSYHKVNLPYGLHTPGADRSETRDLILPESLTNKTVLDVGCALGYFSFEAEERKAKKVVGVELKDDRFRDAMLLKEIKNSKVDFLKRDIVTDPLDESFDYVLLLNVIHHLREPFRAIRQLASITSDRLIIEFPTFADRKFRKTVNIKFPALYNRLPLIGVSSMPGADQTFVFTPSAIKRAMMDHEHLFERVEIFRSPMPDRAIAVCHKNKNI